MIVGVSLGILFWQPLKKTMVTDRIQKMDDLPIPEDDPIPENEENLEYVSGDDLVNHEKK